MTDWFTGDWHFGHANIIKYCNRPFRDAEHMDNMLIDNINECAMYGDRIFNVGDVALKSIDWQKLKDRLLCKEIYVIPGNHDNEKILNKYFHVLPQIYMYRDRDFKIVLSHYALRVWPHSHHGVGHLYGHSHGNLPNIPGAMCFDVGVDCWNYKPLSLGQVQAEFKRRAGTGPKYVVDHHGADDDVAP